MVRRMVGPGAVGLHELERESGIARSTLARWREGASSIRFVSEKKDSDVVPVDPTAKRPQDWSPIERAQFVVEAAGLGEPELGELLRRRGLHREHLEDWRASLEDALSHPRARRTEAKRIKELEREIARKDKALAETAALLVLQKKLQLLFPAGEDDDTDGNNDE